MKKIFFIIVIFILAQSISSHAQFQMRYGSSYYDHASRVIQTQNGNYIVVGNTNGFGSGGNALIMKVNATGTILWVKDYSGINADEINDIIELSDKNLVMCGATGSYGAGEDDFFVMKTDSSGNLIWARAYGTIYEEYFLRISQDGAGGFYAAGYASDSLGNEPIGSIVVRMDNAGNMLWNKWVNDLSCCAMDMTPIASGGVILAESVNPNNNFSLYKYDISGNLIWSNNYLPTPVFSGLFGLSVLENSNGEVLVDYSIDNQNTVAQSADNFILKLNSNGSLISDNAYGGIYSDINTTMANTSDGGLILTGYTNSAGNGGNDAYLIKLNSSGSVQWAKAYGTVWNEEAINVVQTFDGGFVFTGFTYSTGNAYDSTKVYLVKTDSLGNTSCHDISWNPVKTNQTVSIGSATVPINRIYLKTGINWALNNRHFYTADICNPASVSPISYEGNNINIFPNPFSSSATISINGQLQMSNGEFIMYDVFGRVVKNFKPQTSNFKLERGNLPSGIYFYKVSADGKILGTGKVVVE